MIGRQEQLSRIIAAANAVAAGNGAPNVLFITGEAGIGKTTLLKESARVISSRTDRSWTAAFTQCSTPLAGTDIGEVESLQPWGQLMAQLLELSAKDIVEKKKTKFDFAKFFVDTAPAWVTMVPVLGPSVGAALEIVGATYDQYYFNRKLNKEQASQNAANQQQVFRQYINFLAQASAQQPLVLIIDDFHWADTSSTNLLFAAARELQGKPIVFVIAYRADDAMSSRGGEGHPLLHIRNELQRYNLSLDIDVPVLSSSDLDQLLRSRYPNYQNNDIFEEWLARAGSGNALFIIQFLTTLEEDGFIDATAGIVREGFASARVPASAQAVVQERIRRLNEDTREMLRYASVEGDTFTAVVLARLTETPQLKLLQKLRLAEETHRFVHSLGKQRLYAHETTAYRFTHTLLHKVLYDSLEQEERELLHEAVFDILKDEWEAAQHDHINIEGTAMRLAVHAEILGKYIFAAEILLEGARASWQEFAEQETARQLDKVFALLQEAEKQLCPDKARIRLLHGDACAIQGRMYMLLAQTEKAEHAIHLARRDFEEEGDLQRLYIVLDMEIELLRSGGRFDEAEEKAYALLQLGKQHGLREAEAAALGELGAVMYLRADHHASLAFLRQSLELTSDTSYQSKWRILNNMGLVEIALTQYSSALEHFRSSFDILRMTKSRVNEAIYLNNIAIIEYHRGNLDAAIENLQTSIRLRQSVGDVAGVATTMHNIGLIHMHRGEVDKAAEYYDQSLESARSLHMPILVARIQVNLGNVERKRNNFGKALEYYRASLETARNIGNRDGIAIALINLGSMLRFTGHFDESRPVLEEAYALSREITMQEYEHATLCELALLQRDSSSDHPDRVSVLREVIADLQQSISALENINPLTAVEWKDELKKTEQELAAAEALQQ